MWSLNDKQGKIHEVICICTVIIMKRVNEKRKKRTLF